MLKRNLLSKVSTLAIAGVLLGSFIISPSRAMEEDEEESSQTTILALPKEKERVAKTKDEKGKSRKSTDHYLPGPERWLLECQRQEDAKAQLAKINGL